MHQLLLRELTAHGHRYEHLNFQETCAITATRLYSESKSDKSVKMYIKPDSKDFCIYIMPKVERSGGSGVPDKTKLIVYTRDLPEHTGSIFDVKTVQDLCFLFSHEVLKDTYKKDMRDFLDKILQKYPFHPF